MTRKVFRRLKAPDSPENTALQMLGWVLSMLSSGVLLPLLPRVASTPLPAPTKGHTLFTCVNPLTVL